MRHYSATLQFRTTLDQAGRIAGLAGELETTESDVTRRLVDRALDRKDLLRSLRAEIHRERQEQEQAEREYDRQTGVL
jgi:hypothetical protein